MSGAAGPPSVKRGVETESYTCLSPAQISPDPMALRPRLSFDGQSSHTVPWPCREARLSREPGSLTNPAQPGPRASAAGPGSSSSFLTFSSARPEAHRARVSSLCGTLADVPTPHLTLPKEWLVTISLAFLGLAPLAGGGRESGVGGGGRCLLSDRNSRFSVFAVVSFHRVPANTELVNTETMASGGNTELGFW